MMINLKVDGEYLRRDGRVVYIKSSHRSTLNRIVFTDYNNDSYYENGSYWDDDKYSQYDLIEEIVYDD